MNDIYWNNQKIVIVSSESDIASKNISEEVQKLNFPVFNLQDKSFLFITENDLPEADVFLILSRHSSAAGEPAFTVHSVGNFSTEEPRLGGNAAILGKTQADIQTYLLYSIKKIVEQHVDFFNFDVVSEATHHGPFLKKPVIFVEMGSTEEVWKSNQAAKVLAKSIKYFFENFSKPTLPIAIGFGGGHYPRKIANAMINLDYAVGHICPKYALDYLNEELISQMINNNNSKVEYALFDKKGMKKKQEIREIVTKFGLNVVEL